MKKGWAPGIDKRINELVAQYKKDPVILQDIGSWCGNQKNYEKAFEILCRAASASRVKGLEGNRNEALNQIIKINQAMTLEAASFHLRCFQLWIQQRTGVRMSRILRALTLIFARFSMGMNI